MGTACAVVANAVDGATYTCSSATTSRVSACKTNFWKDTSGVADVCKAVTTGITCGKTTAGGSTARGSVGATATADATCAGCAGGLFAASATADCATCTVVSGAVTGATYTCSSATTSRVSACAATCTTKKTVGTTGADTCTATCAAGTWDNANTCQPCAAIAKSATGSTLTCTSNTNSQLVGDCETGYWKVTSGTADVCTMHNLCTGLQLAVGQCAAAARAVTTAGSLTKDTMCATCTDGTYAPNGQTNCLACTPVAGAATDATITCTTNGDSRVSKCLATKKHTAGTAGNHDTCENACAATAWDMAGECTACTKVTWAAAGSVLGCSSATNSKFTAGTCATGYYEVSNTCTASADTCVACTAVANGVGLTCTSATTSQVTSCSADNLFQSSDNADSDADSCVAVCTACAFYAKDNVCTVETACAGHTN